MKLSEEELQEKQGQVHALIKRFRMKEAEALAAKLHRQYPEEFRFAYLDAVMIAEDTAGYGAEEVSRRYRKAANRLAAVKKKFRKISAYEKQKIQNEYLWFSREPYKQYRLGLKSEGIHLVAAIFSQGVGAAMMAKKYCLAGKPALGKKWGAIAERAWLRFFRESKESFSGYHFFILALACQGKEEAAEKAIAQFAKYTKKPLRSKHFDETRAEVAIVVKALSK